MREIKFRAWEKNLKEIITVDNIDFEKKMINTESAWRLFDEVELMQYTGLKDKNGKEIYEGDIVNSWASINDVYLREVVVDDNEPSLTFKPGTGYTLCKNNEHLFDVIGNIYENPELSES
jgi:uncharacterized phage protein (TIGR01671 family)